MLSGPIAKHLQDEVKRTVDRAIKGFSVMRAAGQKDEKDQRSETSEDSDEGDSIEFLGSVETEKVLGPQIPAEHRLVVAQALQKMGSLWNEKKQMKGSIIQDWRLKTANKKLGELKDHNQAFMSLHRVFQLRMNSFFKIGMVCAATKTFGDLNPYYESARPSFMGLLNDPRMSESIVIDRRLTQELAGFPNQEINRLQQELEQLRTMVKQKDEYIRSLEEEKAEWINLKDQSLAHALDSPVDKQLTTMTTGSFTKYIPDTQRRSTDIVLPSPLSEQNARNPLQSELDDTRKRVRQLEDDLKKAKQELQRVSSPDGKNADGAVALPKMLASSIAKAKSSSDPTLNGNLGISSFRKIRLMVATIARLERNAKLRSFISMVKATVKQNKAKGEAGIRIKGRLIQFLSEKHGDSGVRRSFLRWAVFINKNFLRDCITKVALNSRLTHQSALWRFLKMVPRNIKVKLSEGAKRIRYLKAFSMMELMININNLLHLIQSMNQIRPGVIGYKNRKLIDLLMKRAQLDEASKLKSMFGIVKQHRNRKDLCKDLITAYSNKLADALSLLRRHNEISKLKETLYMTDPDFITSADIFSLAAKRNVASAISLDRPNRISYLLKSLINKITAGQKKMVEGGYTALSNNLEDYRKAEAEAAWKKKLRESALRKLLDRLVDSCKAKESHALNKLAGKVIAEKFEAEKQRLEELAAKTRRDKLLKGILGKGEESWRSREKTAYDRLLAFITNEHAREKYAGLQQDYETYKTTVDYNLKRKTLNDLFRKLIMGANDSKRNSLSKLRNLNRDAENEERLRKLAEERDAMLRKKVLAGLLARLANGASQKLVFAKSKLLANKNFLVHSEEIEAALAKARQEAREKNLRKMIDRLKLAQEGKVKEALSRLQHNNFEISHRKTIFTMNKATADSINRLITNSCFDRLVKAQRAKQKVVFKTLGDYRREADKLDKERKNTIKKASEKLAIAGQAKLSKALASLRLLNAVVSGEDKFVKEKRERDRLLKSAKVKTLLDSLITAQIAKEQQSLNNLGYHCALKMEAETLIRTKEEAAKRLSKEILSKLLDKIKRAYDAKGKEILGALLENSKKVEFEEGLRKAKAEAAQARLRNLMRILGDRIDKGNEDLVKEAFERIKSASLAKQIELANIAREEERVSLLRRTKALEFLERLKAACQAKEREVFVNLKLFNDFARSSAEWHKALDEYRERLRNKSLAYALARISGAHDGRLRDAYHHLVENARDAMRKEKLLNDKLVKAQFGKIKHAYDNLHDSAEALKNKEALDEVKRQAEMTLEETEMKNRRRRIAEALNRLKLAQDAKQADTLRHLKFYKLDLEHDEETRRMAEEAANKIRARKVQGFLTKLKLAQNAKQTEALATARKAAKDIEAARALREAMEEAQRALRAKTIKQLGNFLAGSSIGKLAEGLRILKGNCQKLRDMEAVDVAKIKSLLAKLIKAQGLKTGDALARISSNNLLVKNQEAEELFKKMREEEAKKNALKALFDGLYDGLFGKLGVANGLLKSNNLAEKTEEERRRLRDLLKNQKLLSMLNGLIKAQQAKEQACLQIAQRSAAELARIDAENEIRAKMQEEKLKASKLAAVKQLVGASNAKTLAGLGLLKENMAFQNMLLNETERQAYLNGLKKNNLLKGLINAQLGKESISFNLLKRHSDMISAKNIDAKKAQAISRLLKNNQLKLQNALRRLILNGMTAAADKERQTAKVLKMLKQLVVGQEGKEKTAINRAREWAASEAYAEHMKASATRHNLEKLMFLAGKTSEKNREFCYLKMAQYAKDAQKREALKKLLMAALLRGLMGKLKESGNHLRKFNFHETNKTRMNETLIEIEQDKVMLAKKTLLERLVLAQQAKQRKALEELQLHNEQIAAHLRAKEKATGLMTNLLRRTWGDARVDAYRLMVKFARIRQLQAEKDKVLLEDMLRRLAGSSAAKMLAAFNRLKDKNAKDRLEELKKNKLIADLLRGLENAYGQKVKDTFGKMKDHYMIVDSKLSKEGYLKSQLVKNLVEKQKSKLSDAFNKLEVHNRDEGDRLRRESELLKLLAKKLVGASGSKQVDSLFLLRNHCKNAELEETKNKLKRRKLLERLVPAQVAKQEDALQRLRDHHSRVVQEEKYRKTATGMLLLKLVAAQNAKQLEAIRTLDKFKDELLRRATQARDKLNFLIKKVNAGYTGKLYDAVNIMRKKNSTDKRLLEEFESKMMFLLNKLAASHFLKTLESFQKLHKLISGGKSSDQIKAEASEFLVRRLVNSQNAKQAQALTGLNKHSAESQFIETLNNVARGKAFSKLYGNMNLNLRAALDHMRLVNNLMKQREAEARDALNKMIKRLELASFFKSLEAIKRLDDNHKNSLNDESRALKALKFMLNKLAGSSAAKQSATLKDLYSYALLNREDPLEVIRANACKRLLTHLVKACLGKTSEANGKLHSNAFQRKAMLERLLQGLVSKNERLAGQAVGKLRSNASQAALQDAQTQQLLDRLEAVRRKAADQSLRDLLAKMKAWKNAKVAQDKNTARVAAKLNLGWNNAKIEAYRLLKQRAEADKRLEDKTENMKASFIKKLVKAQEDKEEFSLNRLTDYKNKCDAENQKKSFLIRLVMSMLGGSCGLAMKSCLGLLRKFNADANLRELEQAAKRKELLRKLAAAQELKRNQAYAIMQSHTESALEKLRRRMELLKGLLAKLENACRIKQGIAVQKLKDRSDLFEKLLNRLRVAGETAANRKRQLLANANKKLRDWCEQERLRDAARLAKSQTLKERIAQWLKFKMEDEQRKALDRLIKNAYELRIREEMIKKMFNDIAAKKELQIQRVVSIMRLNNVIKSVKESEKSNKLGKLLVRMYNRLILESYHKLHRKTIDMPRALNLLLSNAEERRNKRLLRHFYDQMIEILKNRPQRVERFVDFLNAKIRLRQQQGFSEIKLFLELSRRERINKGLVKMIEMFSKARGARCRNSYEEIKRQFHNDNPWFRKAIDKMTISVTCSEQVAFWKLRKEEKFGSAIVNVEKAIKLKKFLQIFDKKRSKLMTSALERILARKTYGLADSMLNASYLSMSNRNSLYRR